MEDFIINIGKVEEMQMIKDVQALDEIFQRAKQTLVGGGMVALMRDQRSGESWRVGELTNLEDFDEYKKTVYKYLPE
jgi:hypothetical protein